MKVDKDTAPKDTKPKFRRKEASSTEYVPADPSEPLRVNGKPFSEKHTAAHIRQLQESRQRQAKENEADRRDLAVTHQIVAQFLHGLPEFQASSDEQIQKISRKLVKTLSQSKEACKTFEIAGHGGIPVSWQR